MKGSPLPSLVVLFAFVICTKAHSQTISCHSSVNVSLDQDCSYILEPTDVLSESNGGEYSVLLTTSSGQIVQNNTLTDLHVGTSLTAQITQAGNSCWGTIHVEDKLGPVINCVDRVVDCFDPNEYVPTAMDACSQEATVVQISNDYQDLSCDPLFTKMVVRGYQATDAFGNTSSCTQTLSLRLFDESLVVWPEAFKTSTGNNLICNQVANSNGIPDLSLTGAPFVLLPDGDDLDTNPDTLNLYPYQDVYCNIAVDYRDIVTTTFGCKKVIMRTWLVNGWSCSAGSSFNNVQTIEIADSEPPTVDCGAPFVTVPLSGQNCTGTYNVALPIVSDDCSSFFGSSGELEIDIKYSGGFVNNATQGMTIQVSGIDTVSFTVYDDCGNFTTCDQVISLIDEAQPVAICDLNSVVSLRSDGTAIVRSSTFDDGSFDNCEMTMVVIKRENSNCPCESGELDGFQFLGEQSGRYFYLAETGSNAPISFNMANSLGGNVAILSDPSVVQFLNDELVGSVDSIYFGLTLSAQGVLTWSDHSLFSGVGGWAAGQLNADGSLAQPGSYVILNEDREWEVVSGDMMLPYILEVTDPCGFSNTIDFCCADAGPGMSHTVELRAIDSQGNFGACTANVVVQDKVEPIVNCPPDMTFDCSQSIDFTDKTVFGDCTFSDNCTEPTVTGPLVDVNMLNTQCNTGVVTRTFIVADTDNEIPCVQTLTAVNTQPFDPATIVWPANLTVTGCADDDFSPEALEASGQFQNVRPTFTETACSNVAVSVGKDWAVNSQIFLVDNTCSQIIRTWTVIDWCGPLLNGLPPTYEFQQVISITESVAPEIMRPTCDMETFAATTCVNGTGMANFTFSVFSEDNCTLTSASIVEQLFYSGTPTLVASNIPDGGTYESSTIRPEGYPVGDHKFIITVQDACGNASTCDKVIRVEDTLQPSVTCNEISIPVQIWNNVPMVVLNAVTLAEVSYGCAVYTPRISFSSTELIGEQRIFCNDLTSSPIPVTVYVTDDFGLNTNCEARITVTQLDLCGSTNNNTPDLAIVDCDFGGIETVDILCGESASITFFLEDLAGVCDPQDFVVTVIADYNSNNEDLETRVGDGSTLVSLPEPGLHTFFITGEACNGSSVTCTRQIQVDCLPLTLQSCMDTDFSYPCDSPEVYINTIIPSGAEAGCSVALEATITYPNGSTELITGEDAVEITINPDDSGLGLYTYSVTTFGCGTSALCSGSVMTSCVSGVSNSIGGTVMTETAQQVEQVQLVLQGSNADPEYTDNEGSYAFNAMPVGGSYRIVTQKDSDPLEGVSTLDLIQIQRHILAINRIESPYKLIAADIDNSGTINGVDLIELRKLILGVYTEYPDNNSWRIVDAQQDLGNDPFVSEIRESYIVSDLSADMQIDFIGVKVGDVDQSYSQFKKDNIVARSEGFRFELEEKTLKPGIQESIIVTSNSALGLHGVQVDLNFDTEKVAVLDLLPIDKNLTPANFNMHRLSEGKTSLVWYNTASTNLTGELFELIILPYEEVELSEVMSIDQKRISAEAYASNEVVGVNLAFNQAEQEEGSELLLMQNSPNPWSEQTEITYYLPQASSAVLSVFDISGRVIYSEEREANQGLNSIILDKEDLNVQGVLYYELVTDNGRKIQKMILME